jgi:feruloyl-CoA synthase
MNANAINWEPEQMFAPSTVELEHREDGSILLRSPQALGPYPATLGHHLEHWAKMAPERVFLAERDANGQWAKLNYRQAHSCVRAIAAWLLGRNLSPQRPVAILSDNSVEHALLMLATMHIGVPVCSMSAAYSLMSRDFGKLKANIGLLDPGVIFVDDHARFAPALEAIRELHSAEVICGSRSAAVKGTVPFTDLQACADDAAVDAAFAKVTPDTIAKFLFTSGSVGAPKAVINTHGMLCSNQQTKAQVWPFLETSPPVLLDWLPWSHTFGANHNFNMVLRNGGSLYIDAGKPAPGLIEKSIENLREISPTIYFNVPRGYDILVSALQQDKELCQKFFHNLQVIFYAGAALPQHLYEDLDKLARATLGRQVPIVSGWGSTETAPLATDCHFCSKRAGVIGIPVPGVELKLVPATDKLEVRVRGPNVTPGYWKQPDLTREAFDDEGFYLIGDAVEFVDPERPEQGLLFDGRVGEDFKLVTGTWVHVGSLRVKALDALAPVAQDIVVTGQDRDHIGFLIFPNLAECRRLVGDLPNDAAVEQLLSHPKVRETVERGLTVLKQAGGGSSTYATRALLMAEPPSIDAGEITDKGYINQRLVQQRRADLVLRLYAEQPDLELITPAV